MFIITRYIAVELIGCCVTSGFDVLLTAGTCISLLRSINIWLIACSLYMISVDRFICINICKRSSSSCQALLTSSQSPQIRFVDAIERIDRPGYASPASGWTAGPGNSHLGFNQSHIPKIHRRYIDRLDCVDWRSDISPFAKAKQQRSQGHFSRPIDQIIIVQGQSPCNQIVKRSFDYFTTYTPRNRIRRKPGHGCQIFKERE